MEAAKAEADNLMATELRLGLPGTADDDQTQTTKATPPSTPRGKKRTTTFDAKETNNSKAQVVGWPPVRSYRKSCFQQQASSSKQSNTKQATKEEAAAAPSKLSSTTTPTTAAANNTTSGGSFVKVSMDGAPYLRKVDLRMYKSYRELREALEAMFVSSNNGGNLSEFAVTYQDKDGDLMLVGDVPFEMFTGTCMKLRIMKRSEATGLGSPSEAK
jgi:auxin-responsive protein IAA